MKPPTQFRLCLKIEGRVQGVYFRASTVNRAQGLGITGWVRNGSDGSVEVLAEGPRAGLEELMRWCHQGPPGAKVTRVISRWENATDEFGAFRIRR